jgi:hypothetical protein
VHDPAGSWWDAADFLVDGVGAGAAPVGDCDPATPSTLHENYPGTRVESDRADLGPGLRDHADFTFFFFDGYRGEKDLDPYTRTETLPDDGGLAYTRNIYGGALWSAVASSLQDPQLLDRSDMRPAGARYATFYASLNASDIVSHSWLLPTPTPGTYGVESCGSSIGVGAPDRAGWVCDPSRWYRDPFGRDITPRYSEGSRLARLPGDPYFLRDVDCLDGEVARGRGVYASLAPASPGGVCAT